MKWLLDREKNTLEAIFIVVEVYYKESTSGTPSEGYVRKEILTIKATGGRIICTHTVIITYGLL